MYSVRRATPSPLPPPSFRPLQIEQRELADELTPVEPREGPGGRPYSAARVLVRLHSQPLGTVDVELPAGAEELAAAIDAELGEAVRRHQRAEQHAALADPPFASVVIPTRDRPDLLARSLDAVLALDYPGFEVIVVDNMPSDSRTRELVERSDRLTYLRTDRPGSAAARNDGAALASGELVAFVDDDALVDRHWLSELAAGFQERPTRSA
jgi:O-antigen biosynthesis protein